VLALLQAAQHGVTEAAYQPAAPPAEDTTAPPEAGEEGIYQPGQQQVFGFAPLSTTIAGTRVVVSQPTDVVFAAANQALLLNLGLLLLVTLLAIGAAWYGSDIFILNRLRALLETMQRVGQGDLAARVEHGSDDEVGRLEAEFNTTAATLQQQVAALQQTSRHNQQLQEQERERTQMLEQVVEHYLAFVRQVGAGNLEQRLQETTIEESSIPQHTTLNNLARELNTMVERQQHIIGQIREASTSISSAAAQILTATAEQSSSSTEQSAAITQASSTVAEVKAIAQQSSQQATLVAQESQAMLVMTRQGTQAVEETVRGMGQIRERVQSIAQTILELSERTQAIEVITKTVSELADQSNMLALNAAIEAARAGEQGRSFAVVAQHVRDLAERSKKATGEVQNILAEIQSAANNAVMVTEEGHKGVELGTEQASKAGQAIHRIAEEVENSVQTNVQMASAAQQAMTGMGQIGQAMNAIQQASQQTLASTRQAEQAARALHALAQKLQQTIEMHQ
jgi:methyl-accepting chemotaxis protein